MQRDIRLVADHPAVVSGGYVEEVAGAHHDLAPVIHLCDRLPAQHQADVLDLAGALPGKRSDMLGPPPAGFVAGATERCRTDLIELELALLECPHLGGRSEIHDVNVHGRQYLVPVSIAVDTPHGAARVHLRRVDRPLGALVLGHGAGGGVNSPDLVAAARVAQGAGLSVALVEQPYRVAGRRSPAPARQLDAAWLAVIAHLREQGPAGLPLVVGGRSAGARVACRTAAEAGAAAVLCLAFPLHPPGKADDPSKSRLPELEAVRLPVLVVQGENDPFGMPPSGPKRRVIVVPGNHALRSPTAIEGAIAEWLPRAIR